jgi:hypothetical protein
MQETMSAQVAQVQQVARQQQLAQALLANRRVVIGVIVMLIAALIVTLAAQPISQQPDVTPAPTATIATP